MPSLTASGFASGSLSRSAASISASSLIVSTAAPFSRNAIERSPLSPAADCTCSVRVSVSGLYWSAIARSTRPVPGSIWTMPPLSSRGLSVIGRFSLGQVLVEEVVDVRAQRPQRVGRRDVERVRLGEGLLEVLRAVRGDGLAAVLRRRLAELDPLDVGPDHVLELGRIGAGLLDGLRPRETAGGE